ncbi:MAG: hypothetical protein KBS84_03150 [Treponema sp.]|nr:hypothetical protein [Candidatus Treponema scatequi]
MIGKLICFIIAIILFAFYMGFNLDNKCNIWLFVKTFDNVPAFMNSLISFGFGVLCTLPFALVRKYRKTREIENRENEKAKRKASKKVSSSEPKPVITDGESKSQSKRASILDKINKLKKQPVSESSVSTESDSE